MKKVLSIYLVALIFVLSIIGIIAFFEYQKTKEQYLQNFSAKQLLLAKQAALSLEREIEKLYGLVDVLANIPPVKRYEVASSVAAFKRNFLKVKGFRCLIFFDDHNIPVYAYPNSNIMISARGLKKDTTRFQTIIRQIKQEKEPVIFSQRLADNFNAILYILAPVFNESGIFIGYVVGMIHIDELIQRSINPLFLENSGYIWIMDTMGGFVFHPGHEQGFTWDSSLGDSTCESCSLPVSFISRILSRESGVDVKKSQSLPDQLIGFAHVHIHNLAWIVVVSSKYEMVSRAINEQLKYFLILLLIVVIFFVTSSYWGYRIHFRKMQVESEKKFLEKERNLLTEKEKLNRKFSLLFEHSPDPIFIADASRIIQINKAFETLMDYSKSDVSKKELSLQKICFDIQKDSELNRFNRWLQSDRENIRFETKVRTSKGEKREVILSLSKIHINGEIQIQGVFHDITRIKQLEKEKLEKEHLAILGSMSARLAHEIKNPLASLQAGIQLLESEFAKNDNEKLYFEKLKQEIIRVDKILKDILQFAKNETYHFKNIRFLPVLKGILDVNMALLKEKKIRIDLKDLSHENDWIYADEEKINQLLWNILNNAIQASPPGEVIECEVSCIDEYVRVVIRDHGNGIPEEIKSQLFTPFKSSKTYGTGLGLVISKKIVEKHNGKIEIFSDSSGTTVCVYLKRNSK